jgi:hypothetical protein
MKPAAAAAVAADAVVAADAADAADASVAAAAVAALDAGVVAAEVAVTAGKNQQIMLKNKFKQII